MIVSRRNFGWGLGALAMVGAAPAFADDEWPNVFISPMGKPFRAKRDAPYPVADWFKEADKNADGKIDHAEFIADAAAFFAVLDLNKDGVLSNYEVAVYEHNVAPEVLGFVVNVGDLRGPKSLPGHEGGRLWLAQQQYLPDGNLLPTPDVGNQQPNATSRPVNEAPAGAGPFTLIETPEPITAADTNFDGVITKANFLKLADRRFTALDTAGDGYLVLAKLPKTYVQKILERKHRHGLF